MFFKQALGLVASQGLTRRRTEISKESGFSLSGALHSLSGGSTDVSYTPYHGIKVMEIVPGGPASRSSMMVGDLLTAVRCRPGAPWVEIGGHEDMIRVLSLLPPKSTIRIRLSRMSYPSFTRETQELWLTTGYTSVTWSRIASAENAPEEASRTNE